MTVFCSSRRPEMSPRKRAKLLAHFESRIALREAADPSTPFHKLFKLANPAHIGAAKLSERHELLRRCFVLRAWAALRCARLQQAGRLVGWSRGWYYEARTALAAARVHRRLAAAARSEGR